MIWSLREVGARIGSVVQRLGRCFYGSSHVFFMCLNHIIGTVHIIGRCETQPMRARLSQSISDFSDWVVPCGHSLLKWKLGGKNCYLHHL